MSGVGWVIVFGGDSFFLKLAVYSLDSNILGFLNIRTLLYSL